MSNEIILFQSADGQSRVELKRGEETVWLSQADIAELFATTPQNITLHLKNIFEDGELNQDATCKDYLQVRTEGQREVKRAVKIYNLNVILAVGFRVRSPRGTEFRQWAGTALKEYLVKGFVMNDEYLKDPTWDYFDELLERIRDIRSSEKRFYQKIRDLLALAVDYCKDDKLTQIFFAEIQNKMIFAVTGMTAAELIVKRADPNLPNMNLTAFKGDRVRLGDIYTAKNYLTLDEVTELNRLVTMFLDYAQDRTAKREQIYMTDWKAYVVKFLTFNERNILANAGRISHDRMKEIVAKRYNLYDSRRKSAAAIAADQEDMKALENIAANLKSKGQ